MLEKLKGFRTYLTAFIGLFILPLAEMLTNFDAAGKVTKLVNGWACGVPAMNECAEFAIQVGQGVNTLYLAVVGMIIAYFRSQGKKTPPTL